MDIPKDESKAYPGHNGLKPRKRVMRWFSPWKRSLGTWGFVLNRAAGIGLVVYLYLHLVVLSTLLRGAEAWDAYIALAKGIPILILDVVLIAGLLGHGLNGLRVALIGSGMLVKWQRQLFLWLMSLAIILLAIGGTLVFIE